MKAYIQYTELFSNQSKRLQSSWKTLGRASYSYDDSCKGYLLNLNSGSMEIPKSSTDSLQLIRPYLLFQVFFFLGKPLTLELITTDSEGIKRRLIITQAKTIIKNLMHTRLPSSLIEKNTWLHLYIDIVSLFSISFPMKTFRSLDGIFFSATCKLRRVYSVNELDIDYLLPSGFELPRQIPHKTQYISGDSYKTFISISSPSATVLKKNAKNSFSLPKFELKKKNIFLEPVKSVANLTDFKKEYENGLVIGGKKYFRKKPENKAELLIRLRKITHNHEQVWNKEADFIAEEIEVEKDDLIEMLQENEPEKCVFDTPDFFNSSVKAVLTLRHLTPPFANVENKGKYNPIDKFYE